MELLLRIPLPPVADQEGYQDDRRQQQGDDAAADELDIGVLIEIPLIFTDDQVPAEAGVCGKQVFMRQSGLDARGHKALLGFYQRKNAGILRQ